jgi:excisionase family DNA binding protein
MSKLGRKAKLRSKRRLLAGLVNQFENNTNKRRAAYRSRAPPVQLADSIDEFMRKANVSRATVWRMMKAGKLRFVRLGERIRRIPITEYERLGLVPTTRDIIKKTIIEKGAAKEALGHPTAARSMTISQNS